MFFTQFPLKFFNVATQESLLVTDFIRAVRVDPILKEDPLHYVVHTASDGETPEIISHKYYKSPHYHWVIMLLNEKFDPFNDFPQSDEVVRKQTIRQFGDLLGVHHYINNIGEVVDEFEPIRFVVTNYEYMAQKNEAKRQVKVLRPELLAEFVHIYAGAISNG